MLTDNERKTINHAADVLGPSLRELVTRLRAIAAPRVATVGELLATIDDGHVIEFEDDPSGVPIQIDARGDAIGHRMFDDGYWCRELCTDEIAARWMKSKARLVPASEADADPSTRGPIGEG